MSKERYEVNYGISNDLMDSEINTTKYLTCFKLKKFLKAKLGLNLSSIDLNDLNYLLYDYYQNLTSTGRYDKNRFESNRNEILDLIKSRDYVIFKHLFCLVNNHDVFYEGIIEDCKMYVVDENTFDLFNLKLSRRYNFVKLVVLNIPYPYSECKDNDNEFMCKNECIKKRQRFSIYFYKAKEEVNGIIYLQYAKNKTTIENEQICNRQCKLRNCKTSYFAILNISDQHVIVLKAYLLIGNLNLSIQFIGLTLLFLNISLHQLLLEFIKKLSEKLKLIKKYLMLFQIKIWVINFIFLFAIYFVILKNYLKDRDYPIVKQIIVNNVLPSFGPVEVVICVSIEDLLMANSSTPLKPLVRDREIEDLKLQFQKLIEEFDAYEYKKIDNLTYPEVEEMTKNKIDKTKIDIFLKFQNHRIRVNWQLKESEPYFVGYFRCYQVMIKLPSKKYQILLSTSYIDLGIKIAYKHVKIYFLHKGENFNSLTYPIKPDFSFLKTIDRRSKINQRIKCKDYKSSNLNNADRSELIQDCMTKALIEKNNVIFYDSVIRKDKFSKHEYSKLYFRMIINSFEKIRMKFFSEHKNITYSCQEKYAQVECTSIKFIDHILIRTDFQIGHYEIDLHQDIITKIEEEPSFLKILLEMLGIQVIVFGLNAIKILLIAFKLVKIKMKCVKFVIYVICLIGFSYHLFYTLDQLLDNELAYNQYFEVSDSIQIERLNFCLLFTRDKVDPEFKFNDIELDKLTHNITVSTVFDNISYLNNLNDWIELDRKFEFKDDALHIGYYYFFAMKCFYIKINVKYRREQFEFEKNYHVLKLFFNENFVSQLNGMILFFTELENSFQWSKYTYLLLKDRAGQKCINQIKHEIFEVIYDDRFAHIKKIASTLFSFLYPNVIQSDKEYAIKMAYDFERKTRELDSLKDLEKNNSSANLDNIEDIIIDKLYNVVKELEYNYSKINRNRNKFFNNYLSYKTYEDDLNYNFVFDLSFFNRVLEISNDMNLVELILNLLNVLSIWSTFGILDFYFYILKCKNVFKNLFKLFKKIKF